MVVPDPVFIGGHASPTVIHRRTPHNLPSTMVDAPGRLLPSREDTHATGTGGDGDGRAIEKIQPEESGNFDTAEAAALREVGGPQRRARPCLEPLEADRHAAQRAGAAERSAEGPHGCRVPKTRPWIE